LLNRGGKTYEEILTLDRSESLISMGAWCLMTNHFHLLVRQEVEGGITKFMKKLGTAYSMYFNIRYERTGTLFGGLFKSKLVGNDDNYMRQLMAYIHLNPLEIEFKDWENNLSRDPEAMGDFLMSYSYSSYLDYLLEARAEKGIISLDNFPEYFQVPGSFKSFVENYFSAPTKA
jgi:putative transposase